MTRAEFGKCMATLEAGACAPIPDATMEVWWGAMGDLRADALQAAVIRCLNERQFPGLPTMGTLRRCALEHVHGVVASPEQAFAKARVGLSRYGGNTIEERQKLRKFVGPAICDVIDGIGGWYRFTDAYGKDRAMLYAHFRDAWLRLMERTATERALPSNVRPSVTYNPKTPRIGSTKRIGVAK